MTRAIERAVVFGAGSGTGRATALALAGRGTRVWAVARTAERLAALQREAGPGIEAVAGDATDSQLCERVLAEADPDLVVVSVGTQPRMATIDEQTWESFSLIWNTDLKASFVVGQQAVRRPLRPGSTVVMVSSGAGLGGSPLSGGYAGAKRMQMFLASYLQGISDARSLGIRYAAVAPKQFLAGTAIAEESAAAYAKQAGITVEKFLERFAVPLPPEGVAAAILKIADGEAPAAPILALTGAKGLEPA